MLMSYPLNPPVMAAAVSRLIELFRQGGFRAVFRGIVDWSRFHVYRPVYLRSKRWGTLNIGDTGVRIRIYDAESLRRAKGHNERPVMADFVTEVNANDVVWDVGANIGSYTLLALAQGATVVAFEPGEEARRRLFTNIEANGGGEVMVIPAGLSDESRQARLSVEHLTGTRTVSDLGEQIELRRGADIDQPSPTVLKIDVEGHERKVLAGFGDRLGSVETVYVECHGTQDRILNTLSVAGFEIEHVFDLHNPIIKASS